MTYAIPTDPAALRRGMGTKNRQHLDLHDQVGSSAGTDVEPRHRPKFLLSSVPSDSHMWNLVVLQSFIEEMGYDVVNLGVCVPVEVLVNECRRERPDCVVISTVNGHGYIEGVHIITALRACSDLAGQLVVIGGKFGVLGECDADLERELLARGFDAVYPVTAGQETDAMMSFSHYVRDRLGQSACL